MKYWLFILSVLFCTVVLGQEDCFYDNEELGTSCLMCYKNLEKHVNENMEFKPLWYSPKTRSPIESMRENQLSEKINNDNNTNPVSLELDITPKIFDRGLIKGNEKFEVQFTIPKNNILTNKLKFTINYRQEDWSFEMALVDDSLLFEDKKSLVIEKYPLVKNRGKIKIRLFEDLNHSLILELCQPYQSECSKIGTYKIIESGDISKVKKIIFNAVEKKNPIKDFEFFFIKNNNTSTDAPINEKFVESSKKKNTNSNNEYLSGNKVYALYIYNEKYTKIEKLGKPAKDAEQLSKALKNKIGEFYTSDSISNLQTESFKLDTFISKKYLDRMIASDIIIVHYGGHGFSTGGSNHWLPTNFSTKIEPKTPNFETQLSETHEIRTGQINQEIKNVLDKQYYTIRPIKLLEVLNNKLKDKIIIVISDACRNEIKLDLDVPQTVRAVDPVETNEYIEENFSDLNENIRNYLFLQYSVSAFAQASDENSYTSLLAKLISDKNLLYTSNGRIDDILQGVYREYKTSFSYVRPNSNAIQLNKFNFLFNNWEEFKKTLK